MNELVLGARRADWGKSRKSLTSASCRPSEISLGFGPNNNRRPGQAGLPGARAWGRNPDWGKRVGRFPKDAGDWRRKKRGG